MEKIIVLAVMESLHKRIAYLQGDKITTLTDFARSGTKSINMLNATRRQLFRPFGKWVSEK